MVTESHSIFAKKALKEITEGRLTCCILSTDEHKNRKTLLRLSIYQLCVIETKFILLAKYMSEQSLYMFPTALLGDMSQRTI